MSFLHPQLLWLLALPVLLLARDIARRAPANAASGKILAADAGPGGVTLTKSVRARRARVRWRLCLGLAFAVLAVARPQWGRIEEPVFDQAREVIVAIDLSRSMLADDVKPTRLERARLLTQSLLENTPGERVGLVVFSGTAFLQSPLSGDHEIIRDFLPLLDPGFLPAGGTDYAALLKTSLDAFSDSAADRFLVILSDGEAANDDWRELIKTTRERGVRILALGIGTPAGAMLPDGQGGLIKDERGAVVLSKLDDATLRELARETDGVYTDASQWVDIAALIQSTIDQGRAGEFKETGRVRLAERYQWALAPALLLLLWSFWREFPVRIDSAPVGRLRRGTTAAALIATLLTLHQLSPPAHADEQPPTLPELAATLAQKPTLTADDYAEFARTTLAHGQALRAQGQATPAGIVDDGLAAVDAGRRLDAQAAKWDDLEKSLKEQRKDPPKPPPSQDQNQQPPSKSDQEDKSDDQKPSDQPDSGNPSDGGKSGEPNDAAQEKGDSSDKSSGSDQDQPSDQKSGESSSADGEKDDEPKSRQSAFGDMNEPEKPDEQPTAPQPKPEAGEPTEETPAPEETQRVGGAATGQPLTDDPELMQTLQRLEQLKSQDSPARLFQLLQDPNDQPAPPAGQTW